jgi:hypothetical protein
LVKKIKTLFVAIFSLLQLLGYTQVVNKDALTNSDIIKFHASGIKKDAIKTIINSSVCNFDLSPNQLSILKKNKVPADVISLMFSKNNEAKTKEEVKSGSIAKFGTYNTRLQRNRSRYFVQ